MAAAHPRLPELATLNLRQGNAVDAASAAALRQFHFLGKLMGCALLQSQMVLDLELAPHVWKRLAGITALASAFHAPVGSRLSSAGAASSVSVSRAAAPLMAGREGVESRVITKCAAINHQ